MREILFRGKRADNGDWVYGSLITFPDGDVYIASEGGLDFELNKTQVKQSSVGQYTGTTDQNGKKIFEGDILAFSRDLSNGRKRRFEIWWGGGNCGFVAGRGVHIRPNMNQATMDGYAVVGNIHDNPELLNMEAIVGNEAVR